MGSNGNLIKKTPRSAKVDRNEIEKRLAELNVMRTNDHFVYTSERHGHTYFDKNRIFLDSYLLGRICAHLAAIAHMGNLKFDIVAGAEIGGIAPSAFVGYHMKNMFCQNVSTVFLQKSNDGFALKRGYNKEVVGKKILLIEDVLTSGKSVASCVTEIREAGGDVTAVLAICNRGGVTAKKLKVPLLESFINIKLDDWAEDDCPMCKNDIPVNEELGHGKDFMDKKRAI
jgi:orotate phosphoribosyltransferase